ncbi:MAG: homoserine dehydrogenase, partial [bacterium]
MSSESIGIGILGLGTVGQGVVRILSENSSQVVSRAGRPPKLVAAAVRELGKKRDYLPANVELTDDPASVLANPAVEIVIEAMGGLEPARSLTLRALQLGKHVVTANKALLAEYGEEIFEAARQAGRAVCFEAAVGGGIPIIQGLQVGLAANRIKSISAILNGTCNFILTAMTRDGLAYADVLAEAQRLGYAEA